MIVLVFSVLGCGGNSDKAYKNASKEEGEDIEDSAQIQNALFNKQKWTVTTGMNKELPEYLGKMFSQKDGPDNSKINVSEAYYNFNKNNKHLTIEVHCKINNQNRLLKIDCGQISVEMHSLITGNEWVVKLYNGNNEINETWTGSYNKNQIEKKFWKSDIFSAKIKDNVIRIIFNTNIKIESN
jgi:hypothetical protein